MDSKTCMVIGHREISSDKIEYIKKCLHEEIMNAINDGYNHFISGFAKGTDLYFAEIVAMLKQDYKITLEAVLPYRNKINVKDKDVQRLLRFCDIVGVLSETYTPSCFMKRNRFMVRQSCLVIAVYDGRPIGGTYTTIHYALTTARKIIIISPA